MTTEHIETALNKSKHFAVRIIRLHRTLCSLHQERDLFRPLLHAGTNIGAALAEAECAVSRKDLLLKLYAALKDCSVAAYWLDLLCETEYLAPHDHRSIAADCGELRKLLVAAARNLKAGPQG